ncbi:MAG: carbohydrate-binding module family 20 domain-containing protein [Myxococcota bacterium]|jgi:hypothetical protein|nr:carbohydrate-binding module family 20 domain-containing protein [Myxococcota bacterium]
MYAARTLLLLGLLLVFVGCDDDPTKHTDLPSDADAGAELDADTVPDADGLDTDGPDDESSDDVEADLPDEEELITGSGLSGRVEVVGGASGTVLLELRALSEGAQVQRFQLQAGQAFFLPELADGSYGVLAWLDLDGDQTWDGIWEGDGEPTARFGITLPRHDFVLSLRRGVPEPVLAENPEWVELYHDAWDLARSHIAAGTPQNGFAHHYLDEAFSEQVFQWDSCFMTLFARYGADAFPAMEALDNFYGAQREDGFICRVVDEDDGEPCTPTEPSEPMINPPLFGWAELLFAQQTGDLSRLARVIPVLQRYHDWLDANVRTATGLYYTSMLGSGMDNAPREAAFDAWVDISAQQALGRRVLGQLQNALGRDGSANIAEAERLCAEIRRLTWSEDRGFFFDVGWGGALLTEKTLAGIWPVLAGCATTEQGQRVLQQLASPSAFWRLHVFASTAADAPSFDPRGHYWRGGVWAPTNYASIRAISQVGQHDLARRATANHLHKLSRVWHDFEPQPGELAPDANGDGRNTLWELYAPDALAPGTRWDAQFLGRQQFVGWTGLGPIALLLEQLIGLQADAEQDRLVWRISRTDEHGVRGFRFGDQLVDLIAQERRSHEEPLLIEVQTSDPFTLVVELGAVQRHFEVKRGASTLQVELDEPDAVPSLVPSGPYAGYAVLGNGRLSVAYSDGPVSAPAPGIAHLYYRSFALDLVETGRLVFGESGWGLPRRVGLEPWFAALSAWGGAQGSVQQRAFVGADDALVFEGTWRASEAASLSVYPYLRLRAQPELDGELGLLEIAREGDALLARYSDGTVLALSSNPPPAAMAAGELDPSRFASDGLPGAVNTGRGLALKLQLELEAAGVQRYRWVVAVGDDEASALSAMRSALGRAEALQDAREYWEGWSPEQLCGELSEACRIAAANLYAARASSLGGQVPADLTGQFVTNGFPQLYPRDALMVALAMHRVGHDEEAWEIVHEWLRDRDRPNVGELYARYDAKGRGVDAGSGAPFDLPEWDSNGYLATLVERLGAEALSPAEREALLLGLDFLVARQDEDGLWTEGGIVEWDGRLPATAMSNWVGLDAGARLAEGWQQPQRAASYRLAAARIHRGLFELVDHSGPFLGDQREGAIAYDSSLLFGAVWGYPALPVLDATYAWLMQNATAYGGGVRYFWGNGYGQDLFYFTTSAATQYALKSGATEDAERLWGWMRSMTNSYGLAPERIYASGSGAAPATPLSWCAAELGTTALAVKAAQAERPSPTVDGRILPGEYDAVGALAVATDAAVSEAGAPTVLLAALEGSNLLVGLRFSDAPSLSTRVYLSGGDGLGPVASSAAGLGFDFRCGPELDSGALALVELRADGSCVVGVANGSGFDAGPCLAVAGEGVDLEAAVDLSALGLSGAVQLLAEAQAGEALLRLPGQGAVLLGAEQQGVLLSLEVDASGVAGSLDPGAGVVVTVSGDRPELGSWVGHALALHDDGSHGDRVAGDDIWTVTVALSERGQVEYKYLIGRVGDASWAGVEFEGANRAAWAQDLDASGRVRIRERFAVRDWREAVDW